MRVLITGGAGFIGSHLADALLGEGHQVTVIDDLSTGSFDNIAHLKGRAGFRYTIDTVMNEPVLAELVDQCDVVYHLAAAVGVRLIVESPVRTLETNVHGTEVVLKAAAKKQRTVVVASTSEVYGKSDAVPFREDGDIALGPTIKHRWAYACSKALDEFLALAYWKEKRLPVIIVRFFNTVGPRQTGRYGMVVPNFVRQALAGEPITVFGDGTQTPVLHVRGRRRRRAHRDCRPRRGARQRLQRRQHGGDIDPRPGRAREGADEELLADRAHPVRPGVRERLRGHAAPRA